MTEIIGPELLYNGAEVYLDDAQSMAPPLASISIISRSYWTESPSIRCD
jgi:hypothetical protein